MANWNLRTLVLMRSLCMLIFPFWILMVRVGPSFGFWYPVVSVGLILSDKLEKVIRAKMDECAQALLDRLTRHVENLTYVLAVGLMVFLATLPAADNPGAMGIAAAHILAWGIFGIHLYRGISFWVRDRTGTIC